jgi:hypothetical protein
VAAIFDDRNLVSCAGLVPLLRLAGRVGLGELAGQHIRLGGSTGANVAAKVGSIVAGMAAGADSISDLDLLRHGGMGRVFAGIRAPSTLGAFLRWFTIGHVRQLEKVARQVLIGLADQTPLLPGAQRLAFLDVDAKITQVYGPGKQGARRGHKRFRGYNTLAATLVTPGAAPVIVASRLRGGNVNDCRHARSLIAAAIATARACRAVGELIVRLDSAFYVGAIIKQIQDTGARFSVTVKQRAPVRAAIAAIAEQAWQPIRYAEPVYDEQHDIWVSTAELAETRSTAFTNPTLNPGEKLTARLIVRRTPIPTPAGQDALFPTYRYHAIFTDTLADLVTAEAQHRGRAGAIEQVFADLNDSALAHFPSGHFAANAAWLTLATLAHNLTRAAGCLAGPGQATARTGTLRRQLIAVGTRIARSARRLTLHLPQHWPWQQAWQRLFTATHAPPTPA